MWPLWRNWRISVKTAVKSGFASGYSGEGPHRFSYVLQALDSHGAEIDEFDVAQDLLERIDQSAMTRADFERLEAARPRRPHRWHDYVFEDHHDKARNGTLGTMSSHPLFRSP